MTGLHGVVTRTEMAHEPYQHYNLMGPLLWSVIDGSMIMHRGPWMALGNMIMVDFEMEY